VADGLLERSGRGSCPVQALAVIGLLLLVACGGGGGSGPSAPAPIPLPNYAGTWTATYAVSSCTSTGFFADAALCGSVLNTTAAATFVLAQTDRAVTGTFSLGTLNSPSLSVTIGGDGALSLAAPISQGVFTIDTTWTLQQATAGVLTGQTRQVWTASGQSGEAVLQGSIVSATRASSALAVAPLPQQLLERLSQRIKASR
jgi:hypothetical protein